MIKFNTIDIPQANSLRVLGNLLARVAHGYHEKKELSQMLRLDPREVDYYMHAARILGFADYDPQHSVEFCLTPSGEAYLETILQASRMKILARAVRDSNAIKELLARHSEAALKKETVAVFLREVTTPVLSWTTARRRADSILAWLQQTREGVS